MGLYIDCTDDLQGRCKGGNSTNERPTTAVKQEGRTKSAPEGTSGLKQKLQEPQYIRRSNKFLLLEVAS